MRTYQTLKISYKILTGTHAVLINDDNDEAYDLFQSILLTVFNELFPIQTKYISYCEKKKRKIFIQMKYIWFYSVL